MTENKVLAEVEGRKITEQDIEARLRNMDQRNVAQYRTAEGKQRILRDLINQELMYSDALENDFDKEEPFQKQMAQIKEDVLKQYAVRKLLDNVQVSKEQAKEYYQENKEQFKKQESVRASHILVKDEETANNVLKEINEGTSFEEIEGNYSQCDDNQAGDLGYFTRGKMVQPFEDAAFEMEVGEIRGPVKTQFGYHIIKLTDKKEAGSMSYEEVEEKLIKQMTAMEQNRIYQTKSKELEDKYEVVIPE